MEDIYIDTARLLKAISDPKRLKIVDMLSCHAQCANKLQAAFSITQPTLSHDMKVLVESGLVLDKRDGKHIYYSLNPEALQKLHDIMGEIFQKKSYCMPQKK
jgi:ArsR family transcriptional regulator, arsenate/arsenite/antimonite-responsive transcriptional repressor